MRREPPDILITTPESLYLMISSGAREILGGVEAVIVDEIHAVAPSKRGSHLALTLERLDRAGEGELDPEDRPLGDAAPSRAHRRVPGRSRPRVRGRRRQRAEAARPRDRRARGGHGGAQSALEQAPRWSRYRQDAAPGPLSGADRSWSDRGLPRPGHQHTLDLAGDLPGAAAAGSRAQLDDRLRQQPARGREDREAPQRDAQRRAGGGAAGDRACRQLEEWRQGPARDRPRPPRLPLPRGARAGRGAAQVRRAALPGRDLVAGAGHRHGRRRPRDPGRVAEVGHPRPPARRPRRPHARRGLQGPDLPQVPRRPARVRGGRPPDARRARSRRRSSRRTPSTSSPSTWSRWRRSTSGRSTRWRSWFGPRSRSPSSPASSSRTCSTCSTGATRRSASRSCARGSSGTAPRARCAAGRAHASWRSPTPGRSRTAVSTAFTCRTDGGSASSMRRWSTRPVPARPSCSARAPGGSRRSHATE